MSPLDIAAEIYGWAIAAVLAAMLGAGWVL